MGRLWTLTVLVLLTGASTWPGAQVTTSPAFEVVSIKPIEPGLAYPNFFVEGDKLRGNHVTAAMLVATAYGVPRRQVLGGPDWINSARFNIDARATRRLPPKTDDGGLQEPVSGMLRRLLADRFRLRVRSESREMPVWALVHARQNFTPVNTHLRPAKVDCTGFEGTFREAPPDLQKTLLGNCFERTGGEMHVRGRPMSRLAYQLGRHLGRTVIDETRLSGLFDVDLDWDIRPGVSDDPAILLALEEQLGMKLVERMAVVPVVAIERIERPTPN